MNFKKSITYIILVVLYFMNFSVNAKNSLNFSALLKEAGLELQQPSLFQKVSISFNEILPYEYAIQHRNKEIEIRYSIRPIKRIKVDYKDAHSATPDPNYLFTMMFSGIVNQLTTSANTPQREYPVEQSRQRFNAGWAAAAVLDVDKQYSTQYQHALLLALHKNDLADAYVVFLYNDYQKVKSIMDTEISTLRFIQ